MTNFYARSNKRAEPNCGTCAGSGITTRGMPAHTEYGWKILPIECPDCALVPELAKIKAERSNAG